MKVYRILSATVLTVALAAALAGCGGNKPPAAPPKPAAPTAAEMAQRSTAAQQAYQKAMAGTVHPPTDNPAAMRGFSEGMRNAYAAPPPGAH